MICQAKGNLIANYHLHPKQGNQDPLEVKFLWIGTLVFPKCRFEEVKKNLLLSLFYSRK